MANKLEHIPIIKWYEPPTPTIIEGQSLYECMARLVTIVNSNISAYNEMVDEYNAFIDTINGKVEEIDNTANNAVSIANRKVSKSGDTMSGNLNMDGNRITGIPRPSAGGDAVAKQDMDSYVAQQIANKVSKAGDTMSGDLDMTNHKITNVATPTTNGDGVNKQYVDNSMSSKVSKSGDTMGGELNIAEGGLTVDIGDGIFRVVYNGNILFEINNPYYSDTLNAWVGRLNGHMFVGADKIQVQNPTTNQGVVNKQYVDSNTSNKLLLSGGTMSGNIDMDMHTITNVLTPTSSSSQYQVANKEYVDSHSSSTIPSRTFTTELQNPSGTNMLDSGDSDWITLQNGNIIEITFDGELPNESSGTNTVTLTRYVRNNGTYWIGEIYAQQDDTIYHLMVTSSYMIII